jgi:hypothetical protein
MRFFILPKVGESEPVVAAPPVAGERESETVSRQGKLGTEAERLLATLKAEPQTVPVLCKALGLSKHELERVVKDEYEALLQAGLRPHVATKSEVPRAIRLPSRLNPEEHSYFGKLARNMGDDQNGGLM